MTTTLKAAGKDRSLYVSPDVVDLRDRYYEPALIALPQHVVPKVDQLHVRDQGRSSACTGFALASVIDRQIKQLFQQAQNGVSDDAKLWPVSTRMLFEMARLHDDLPDASYAGSTLRGALKGFFHNGVCRETAAPFVTQPNAPAFSLSMGLADEARNVSLGAYYRLNHEINDYHAAIAEAGAVIASAKIHKGWAKPKNGEIVFDTRPRGRHAFAIVGYDKEGFLVQNSWGGRWSTLNGLKGVARWSYDDWFEHVEDAWVLRLAISSPRAFRVKFARNHKAFRNPKEAAKALMPRRQDINGHFLHFDDGKLVSQGRYAQRPDDIQAMRDQIAALASERPRKIDHLLIVAHGALQDRAAVATRARAWRQTFLDNGIYPIHLMWETGFNNEVVDVIKDLLFKTRKRMNKGDPHIHARLEELARPLGRKLWRDLKVTARLGMSTEEPSGRALADLIDAAGPIKLHFLAQSAGVFLFSRALQVVLGLGRTFDTASLMAPACSLDHYDIAMKPFLSKAVGKLNQYGLIEKREDEDQVDVYGKSLLYLVSNALEDRCAMPLLGLEAHVKDRELHRLHTVYYAGRDRAVTDAEGHRGFDKDRKTMNHLLETITGAKPKGELAFSEASLSGY